MKEVVAFFASVIVFITSILSGRPDAVIQKPQPAPTTASVRENTPAPTIPVTLTHTPVPTHLPQAAGQSYIHSPDADLGQMGFTVEGSQATSTCSKGTCTLKAHGPFTITAYVKNFGSGMAAEIPYVWYDNDVVIKRGVIGHLAPNVETSVRVDFNSASYSGSHAHRFEINPDKILPEGTMAPNTGRNTWSVEPF